MGPLGFRVFLGGARDIDVSPTAVVRMRTEQSRLCLQSRVCALLLARVILVCYRDNGKENGNYNIAYRGYMGVNLGIMEKNMETTIMGLG